MSIADYQTGDELDSIYPKGTSLSEIIGCRLQRHESYLESNEFINQHQRNLLESASQSLKRMQAQIHSTNSPASLLNRCDEITSNSSSFNFLFG